MFSAKQFQASVLALVLLAASAASAATIDSTTQGNWIGVYGGQGYILNAYNGGGNGNYLGAASPANDTVSLPSYVSSYSYGSGAQQYVWATGDPATTTKDLQDPANPTGPRNAATAFNGTDWSMTLNLSHAEHFNLAVYALDYDNFNGRDITVSVGSDSARINGSNGYLTGAYAVFDVNAGAGPLTIDIHQNAGGGSNSTISGVFFTAYTPEPSALALGSLGALGLLVAVRRRRCA